MNIFGATAWLPPAPNLPACSGNFLQYGPTTNGLAEELGPALLSIGPRGTLERATTAPVDPRCGAVHPLESMTSQGIPNATRERRFPVAPPEFFGPHGVGHILSFA